MINSLQRIAVIDYDRCQPQVCGWLCHKVCPPVRIGKEAIVKDEIKNQPIISEELCIGCGICPKKCPFGAITIINLSKPLGKPFHQFGVNSFRLHGFLFPKNNVVVGLIGANGLGKTTLLKILSGSIIPNLGNYSEIKKKDIGTAVNLKKENIGTTGSDYEQVKQFFKGKQGYEFFDSLEKKQLIVSSKPQNVEQISSVFKGSLKQFFESFNIDCSNPLVSFLGLDKLLERKLEQLSGGELQKAAIIACALKQADVYFFDEPSSFLDVKERLKAGEIISQLAVLKNKAVILIEHDLALLDYLSENVHVLYGEKSVYGVVSNPKSVKNGINEFLEGFLKDENLRFRSNEINFGVKPSREFSGQIFFSYPSMEKNLNGFELTIQEGSFFESEVLGVLGANGIGKTTFVKLLAGIISPDKGEIGLHKSLSYKPQYIFPEKEKTVEELFSDSRVDKTFFKSEIDKKLCISALFEKKLENLSGGELQKTAVALCLSRQADLFLLDEPSASVDVEDRLRIADCINSVVGRKGKTALVVDHDVLFIDYTASRLIVFDGIPGKQGNALSPMSMRNGMNYFLKQLGITFRRDLTTGRPRVNKQNSVLDKEQKQKGEYYYS